MKLLMLLHFDLHFAFSIVIADKALSIVIVFEYVN